MKRPDRGLLIAVLGVAGFVVVVIMALIMSL